MLNQRAEKFFNQATELLNAGFTTKAAQNKAKQALRYAWEANSEVLHETYYDMLRADKDSASDEQTDIHYSITNWLPFFNVNHATRIIQAFPSLVDFIQDCYVLADTYRKIKEAEITKAPNKSIREEVKRVERSISEIMETRKQQFERALKLNELFGGLPVHANVHMVHMSNGTSYVRAFYYLNDEITPLQVIIVAAQAIKREQESA